jgi:hypothetical protein
MRAETVAEIVADIIADFMELAVQKRINRLISALENQSSSPTPENQIAVKNAKDEILENFVKSRFTNYPIGLQITLDEMGLLGYLPDDFRDAIADAFEGNELTPAGVLEEIRAVKEKADKLWTTSEQFMEAAGFFEIEPDSPNEEEDFEFSISIPRSAVNNELDNFGRELVKIDKLMGVFCELGSGSRSDFKIKSISSSELTVILESAPAVAVLIVTALERLTKIYERILNILKLHKELEATKAPESVIREMQKFITKTLKDEIQDAAKEVEGDLLKKVEATRRNELRTELRIALDELASRFDRGYIFDVRGPEPTEVDSEGESAPDQNAHSPAWNRRIVAEKRELLRHFKVEDKPVLGLPKPSNDEEIE